MLIRKFEFPEEMVCPMGLDWNDNIVYGKKEIREHSIKIYDDKVEIMGYDYSTKLLFSSSKVSFEKIYEKTKVTELIFKGEITVRSVKEFLLSEDKKVITIFHTDSKFFKGIRWTFYYTSEAMELIKEIISVIKDAYKKYVENYEQEKLLEILEESNKKLLEIIEESNTQTPNEEPIKPKEIKTQEKDNFKFIVEDNMAIIIGCIENAEKIVIPDKIDGFPVFSIGEKAFFDCSSLTGITIPTSVVSIGDDAFFGCSNLASITIPDSVTSIGNHAFYGCSNLASITIPDSVTSIGGGAFDGCSSLTSITIPEGVTKIEWETFYGCSSLTSITIPEGVTSIDTWAFYGCSSLTSIIIPKSVISIGKDAFDFENEFQIFIETIAQPSGWQYGWSTLEPILYWGESWRYVNGIPTPNLEEMSNEEIIYDKFKYKIINDEAIITGYLGNEENITIPKKIDGFIVTTIGKYAFRGNRTLKSVYLPNTVETIDDHAFYGCINLTHVEHSKKISHIGNYAFYYCKSLSKGFDEIYGLEYIGDYAFANCQKLPFYCKEFGNLKRIGNYAFADCHNLEPMKIPYGVQEIGDYAFYGCSMNSLHSTFIDIFDIHFDDILEEEWNGLLEHIREGEDPHFPLSKMINLDLEIPNSVTRIGDYAFAGYGLLSNVHISNNIKHIGEGVFQDCSYLKTVDFPEGLKSIGKEAFKDCYSLSDIDIPQGVTVIGEGAFSYCEGLKNVSIPNSVIKIESEAFAFCENLEDVYIPSSVKYIGDDAFLK